MIGKKACRLLLTGGDDQKVNLWAIGKPTSLMSLCGHTSPVECVAFDSAELLVLAGASSGSVKLWDLEEAKMVRTLTGHRSNCTAVEFHPFGEFFASGSVDTDLRIWDIRKRGCIHTYKGHTQGINTIKFTPDGRWVVSGGFDNVVKVWDLTAGKLMHDLKFHEGHIRALDFHPHEFLLATGSADRTVKFWDLETFEMIGAARAEATGVWEMAFHPDGRTLFCGYDDNFKVYSWEPVICHDAVDMGWSKLGDLSIHDGKLIGCSYYQNSIGIWAADLLLIKPYGEDTVPGDSSPTELKLDLRGNPSMENLGTGVRFSSSLRSPSPDADSKDIKNIYVDYEKPISSQKPGLFDSPNSGSPFDSRESGKLHSKRSSRFATTPAKSSGRGSAKSFTVPNIVPRDSSDGKSLTRSRRESFTPAKVDVGMSIKDGQGRRLSTRRYDVNKLPDTEPIPLSRTARPKFSDRPAADDGDKEQIEDKYPTVESTDEKSLKEPSSQIPSSLQSVAAAHGRTRSLVERFERRERSDISKVQENVTTPAVMADRIKSSNMLDEEPQVSGRQLTPTNGLKVMEDLMQSHDALLSGLRSRLTKLQMVRRFWERNDIKGAINAVKRLPDHSVQADVISVLMEKMEIITMELFSSLLPALAGLLDSKMERHAKMSLEMLLKLVAVFGPTIRSTISAPPVVGVDLHQEQRIERCKQCFSELQKIQLVLPALTRKGSPLAKSAVELNLVLQDHNI